MSKDDESRLMAVELAKRLLVDAIWKTASIEVDGISFRDTQEIFEGRAPANMAVDDIIVVNNINSQPGYCATMSRTMTCHSIHG